MKRRGSGILCHITSLSSPFGIGDLGPGAYAFADFLCEAKQSYWQVLPVNPTNQRYADSPFASMSSCAGNTVLISPDKLASQGLLSQPEVMDCPVFSETRVDYAGASRYKKRLFQAAHRRFKEREAANQDFQRYCADNSSWLEDHALYTALSEHLEGAPLSDWPKELSDAKNPEVRRLRTELSDAVEREKFLQFVFNAQWHSLKNHCNRKGILIIGDFPLFMNYDSVDIWFHPELFKVDENKRPYAVAGSPPDSFSENGQLFNCALYDWEALKENDFNWWVRRFYHLFKLYDFVRMDHFRGLISYWEVPAGAPNALSGSWKPAMVYEFINAMLVHFPTLPVIAEDLGVITAEVREAMGMYGIPGMRVLLLAFQKESQEASYLPHNHIQNCVVYTGTHDTNTIRGWFDKGGNQEEKARLYDYLGHRVETEVHWELIRLSMMSVGHTVIVQMQDLLGSGEETRMNTPGGAEGNWQWRVPADYASGASRLRKLTITYGRAR